MQYAVSGEPGRYGKETVNAGMLIEPEACHCSVIASYGNEYPIQAIDMTAIAVDIQVTVKGVADKGALPAGYAEATGSTPCGGGLPYCFRPAAQEVLAIALIADEITEFTGKGNERMLSCHLRSF
jgi:hypothetical protein